MKTFSPVWLILISSLSSQAIAKSAIDVRTEYENWNSGINGKATAVLLGLGGSRIINDQWSISGGFVTGSHSFNNSNNASASRQDIDIAIARRLMSTVRAYAGYRLIRLNYENDIDNTRSFTDLTHGLGAGIAGYQALKPKLFAYGRFGFSFLYSSVDFKGAPDDSGTGFGTGLEAGLIYQLKPSTNAGFSIKQQGTAIKYDNDSDDWNHNYLRFGLSLSHTF